jgi:hypothetical protein
VGQNAKTNYVTCNCRQEILPVADTQKMLKKKKGWQFA